jgi:hypothetical protein
MHEPRDLPIVMVSDGKHFQGGRHVQYPKETPLANLYLRMMDMTNMPLEKFGDSTEQLNLLKV